MTSTAPTDGSDRLYFRQLLSGRDFAQHDPIAQQMVNFTYAIGDRAAGECLLVDPAYDVNALVDIVEADGLRVVGNVALMLVFGGASLRALRRFGQRFSYEYQPEPALAPLPADGSLPHRKQRPSAGPLQPTSGQG